MGYAKYYDNLFVDGKVNSKFVTYLSAIHMANVLTKRDKVTNDSLNDLCSNYSAKALSFFEGSDSPLTFIDDDIQVIYDFTKEHIDKILKNPHQSIVKEQQLINKEKLKQIEPKTLNWLANKPGSTIKEKLANVNKVSSTVKRYTYNVKENQLFLAYFKDIYKLLNSKISIIKNNSELFGNQTEKVEELTRKLNKIRFTIKNDFDEVIEKDFSTPNNALIGNVDYAAIWKSYLDIKQSSLDYENAFELYKKSFKEMFISYLMAKYDYVEDYLSKDNINQSILYWIENGSLTELIFKDCDSLEFTIKEYHIDNKVNLFSSKEIKIFFNPLDQESNRGLTFSCMLNDEEIGIFHADLLGFKEVFNLVTEKLSLKKSNKEKTINGKQGYLFASINSFDNELFSNDLNTSSTISNKGTVFENKNIYFANGDNCSLNTYNNDSYSGLLRNLSFSQDFSKNSILIYDIKDTYDEFSSANLRRAFSSIYPQSYPVWRSVLAGESSKYKESIRTVIDLCGNPECISISKLERKNNRFVHCGAIETPLYYEKFTEGDFYKEYINRYQEKYSIQFPEKVFREFITSGKINNVLLSRKREYLLNGTYEAHEFFMISFDEEIFNDVLFEFESSLMAIMNRFENKPSLFVVPDFLIDLSSKYSNVITNNSLLIGAKEIIDRIKKSEITWYEKLPKLSLEIIKNGMFDNLVLVDNQECENIIGKSFKIEVKDTLTLSKGEENYILPLNKSFIGEENESFVAKAVDKSFPLKEDLDVKLSIEYKFGSENSYVLKLKPIMKNGPFEEIEVKWVKEINENNLINPKITDVTFSDEELKELLEIKIPKSLNIFNNRISRIKQEQVIWVDKKGRRIDNLQEANKDIQILINHKQRVSHYNQRSKNYIENLISNSEMLDGIHYLLNKCIDELNTQKTNDKKRNILNWRLETLEEAIVELTFDPTLFTEKKLLLPESGYGRYFAENPHDLDVINIAYKDLVQITKRKSYISSQKFRRYMNKLTSATACRHTAIYEIAETNPAYIKYLLKVIINCLEMLSTYDWNKKIEDCSFYDNPKENGFLMRYCVELLISFLYCRDLTYFSDLRPGGKLANQIIYYLKRLNKNIKEAMQNWDDDFKKKKMLRTKYHIKLEKPNTLFNMWNEAYCLILYLSGDERANYIKIGGDNE